jgi:hypothetical protein
VLKNDSVYAIYNTSFKVVHNKSYRPPYDGPELCHNPDMRKLKKGRPNSTRIKTKMDEKGHRHRDCLGCDEIPVILGEIV